jgi:K(+)-stimulated pyrophosphate-energized sodium pump
VLGAASIVASIVGTFFVKAREGGKIMNALYRGVIVSADLGRRVLVHHQAGCSGIDHVPWRMFGCTLIGLALTAAMIVDHRVLHRHRVLARCARWPRPRRRATPPT